MGTGKPKIQKTCRIRVKMNGTTPIVIYCSCDIIREVRHLVMRFENNVMIPLKGKVFELYDKLRELASKMPEHFPSSSRLLGYN